jgi:hypothetical protein
MKQGQIGQLRWPKMSAAPAAESLAPPAPRPATATERLLELYGLPEVPVPKPTPAQTAWFLLRAAAEIEHGLLVQYLYARYSIAVSPVPQAWAKVTDIAVQEMYHLLNVQNMLLALKDNDFRPYFDRANFPVPKEHEGLYPFPFRLEPFSADSLSKYVSAESPLPEYVTDDALRARLEAVIARAEAVTGMKTFGHVGNLYAYLYWLFLPDDGASTTYWPNFPSEWFRRNRPGYHVKAEDFADPARLDQLQVLDGDLKEFVAQGNDGNAPNYPKNEDGSHRWLFGVKKADDALRAIAQIAIQGEGTEVAEDSHFLEFLKIYDEVVAYTGGAVHLDVPADPHLRCDPDLPAGRITNEVTRLWARLCNTRYLMLLQELPLALSLSRSDPEQNKARKPLLTTAIKSEMISGVRYFAMKLMKLPLADDPAKFAGPPFELPDDPLPAAPADQWRELVRLIGETNTLLAQLRALTGADKPSNVDEGRFKNLETADTTLMGIVPPEFRSDPQPKGPATVAVQQLNSFDEVKALLNQFVTDNGTDLSGSPHGAFWNTDYDSFVNGDVPGVRGVKILVKGDPDKSNLIKILQGPITVNGRTIERMPADGSPFMPPDKIASLAGWIRNNCPQ